MKNVVIAGNAGLQEHMLRWVEYWEKQPGMRVTDWPRPIPAHLLSDEYPALFRTFFLHLSEADVLFVANEQKGDISGYIGAQVFGEMVFTRGLNATREKQIEIILAQMPSERIQAFSDIQLWLKLGWISLLPKPEKP